MEFFANPTDKTIKTNILKSIIFDQSLEEISQIIEELKKTNFDLTKQAITFKGIKYGILKSWNK